MPSDESSLARLKRLGDTKGPTFQKWTADAIRIARVIAEVFANCGVSEPIEYDCLKGTDRNNLNIYQIGVYDDSGTIQLSVWVPTESDEFTGYYCSLCHQPDRPAVLEFSGDLANGLLTALLPKATEFAVRVDAIAKTLDTKGVDERALRELQRQTEQYRSLRMTLAESTKSQAQFIVACLLGCGIEPGTVRIPFASDHEEYNRYRIVQSDDEYSLEVARKSGSSVFGRKPEEGWLSLSADPTLEASIWFADDVGRGLINTINAIVAKRVTEIKQPLVALRS